MNRSTATLLLLLTLCGSHARAFVQQTDRNEFGSIVTVSWSSIRAQSGLSFYLNTRSFPFPQGDVNRVVNDSFQAWEALETSSIRFTNGGTGSFRASPSDGDNVILYDATGAEIGAPPGSGVIAITLVNWNNAGQITDADIIFNGRDFEFSANETPPAAGTRRVDLQDVMTHEIGHLIGLDHTPLNGRPSERPTMNPFNPQDGPGEERTLEADDVAGVTAMYPSALANRFGSISGTVVRPTGEGAFGAHVVAYRRDTGSFVVSALSGSSGDRMGRSGDGEYVIAGLPPGEYVVGIHPVDGSDGITSENLGGIFRDFDTDFPVEFYDNAPTPSAAQTVVVGAGQVAAGVDFILGTAREGFPAITDPILPVNTPDSAGPYPVSVSVSDIDGQVGEVFLIFSVNGSGQNRILMQLVGGRWRVEIPGQPSGAVISYRVAATDDDGNTSFLPPESQEPLRLEVLTFTDQPVFYVVTRNSGALAVIESGSGDEVARIRTGLQPLAVLLTPDDRLAFVANNGAGTQTSNVVTVIETATHRIVGEITVGFGPLDIAISGDGSRVFVSNSDEGTVSVIDAAELVQRRKIRIPGIVNGPFGLAVNAAGTVVYVSDIDSDVVLAVDAVNGEVLARIPVVAEPRSLILSPDGTTLYASGFTGGIAVIDVRTHQVSRTIDTGAGSGAFRIATSPDGAVLFATDQMNGRLLAINPEDGSVRSVSSGGRNTRGLAVSRSGDRVYVTNQDSDEFVEFDSGSLQVVRRLPVGNGPRGIAIRYAAFTEGISGPDTTVYDVDFTSDGTVDFADFVAFAQGFGRSVGEDEYDSRMDLDDDGTISFSDFILFARNYNPS